MAKDFHRSSTRQEIAAQNDGFLEGVCHVLDELRAIAEAEKFTGPLIGAAAYADKLEKTLFAPRVTK